MVKKLDLSVIKAEIEKKIPPPPLSTHQNTVTVHYMPGNEVSEQAQQEMVNWCHASVKEGWWRRPAPSISIVRYIFENQADAALFKLFFSDWCV